MADRRVDYMRLDDIKPAPRNPKGHDPGIGRSIAHHGLGELPLLDERTGLLVAGHGRVDKLRAMRDDGANPPDGITTDTDGTWLTPVIRGWSSRSDEDAEAYLIGSNQLTALGGWDDHGLADILTDLADAQLLELTGHTGDDLDQLVASLSEQQPPQAGHTDPDDVPDPPAVPVTKPGDLWQLGPPPRPLRRRHQPRPPRAGHRRHDASHHLRRPSIRSRHRHQGRQSGRHHRIPNGWPAERRAGQRQVRAHNVIPACGR